MNIEFDMYQTLALAVLVLLLGSFLKKHIHFLEKFCIPAPVIGGLLFAILTCIGYSTGLADFTFDDTLREAGKEEAEVVPYCRVCSLFSAIPRISF